jgi:hypothetical protein
VKRRIFPEFLEAELTYNKQSNRPLDLFYRRHAKHVDIVETDVSMAYKLFYAKKASEILQRRPELEEKVLSHAIDLAGRYTPDDERDNKAIDHDALRDFCKKIEKRYGEYKEQSEDNARHMAKHHALFSPKLDKKAEDVASGKRIQEARDTLLAAQDRKIMARSAGKLLNIKKDDNADKNLEKRVRRLLLQAMYSCPEMRDEIAKDKEYQRYKNHKGERAIEGFLFDRKLDPDKPVVSLVVTDDGGARTSITNLRAKYGKNPIFVLGSYGLGVGLGALVPKDTDVLANAPAEVQSTYDALRQQSAKLVRYKEKVPEDKIQKEEEWAEKFARYMILGKLQKTTAIGAGIGAGAD